jgi:hypothetical protein
MADIAHQDKILEFIKNEIINKKIDLAKKYKELKKNNLDNEIHHDYALYFNNEINNKKEQIDKLRLLTELNDNLYLDINNDYLKKELIHDQRCLMNEIEKINKELKKME